MDKGGNSGGWARSRREGDRGHLVTGTSPWHRQATEVFQRAIVKADSWRPAVPSYPIVNCWCFHVHHTFINNPIKFTQITPKQSRMLTPPPSTWKQPAQKGLHKLEQATDAVSEKTDYSSNDGASETEVIWSDRDLSLAPTCNRSFLKGDRESISKSQSIETVTSHLDKQSNICWQAYWSSSVIYCWVWLNSS